MNRNACLEEFYPIYVIHLNIYENLFTLKKNWIISTGFHNKAQSLMANLRVREGCAPPPVQILSISCSFWKNLVKSYVGATSLPPAPGQLAAPPRGNPRDPPLLL